MTEEVRGEPGHPEGQQIGEFGRYAGPATLILSSLADGPKHGYILTKDIEAFAGVRLAPGTLYEALSRLEGQGLIEAVESDDRRRPYRLTATGATVLRAHLAAQRRVADLGLRRLAELGHGMTRQSPTTLRRAERLLRWYPREWRARYGAEFAALLVADLSEHPRSMRRSVDVARSGLVARLTDFGLSGHALEPSVQIRKSLATLGCAAAVSLFPALAAWAQISTDWQWAKPEMAGTETGMVMMSVAMAILVAVTLAAAMPVVWSVAAGATRHRSANLLRPALLFLGSATVLVVGGRHFGNGWPGTGGHHWALQGLVPGGVAAFAWASTLSVSAYWAHPGTLLGFPPAEIAWMVISPFAMVGIVVATAKTVRRVDLSPQTLRLESRLAALASLDLVILCGGCLSWLLYGGSGPGTLFHVGVIDVVGFGVMVAAVAIACRAVQRARVAVPYLLAR